MSGPPPDPLATHTRKGIFETFVSHDGALPARLEYHCQRVEHGLRLLDLPACEFRAVLEAFLPSLGPGDWRVRWTWTENSSQSNFEVQALVPAPAEVILAPGPQLCRSNHPLAAAKSIARDVREEAHTEALSQGAWDAVVSNETGAWVETTRANFFLLRGRQLWTPGARSGLHAGTTRAALLEGAVANGWEVVEASLPPEVWQKAEEWVVCNAVVGVVPVGRLLGSSREWPGRHGNGARSLAVLLAEGKDSVS